MNEQTPPTHILLRKLKSMNGTVRDAAFEILVYRFYGPFERYASEKLGADDAPLATDDTFVKIYTARCAYDEGECRCRQACKCPEMRAHRYLWRIHENTVIDWLRLLLRKNYTERSIEEIDEE